METEFVTIMLDFSNQVGEIKGTQDTIIYLMSGIGSVGVIAIGYLGHCVYRLGTKLAEHGSSKKSNA